MTKFEVIEIKNIKYEMSNGDNDDLIDSIKEHGVLNPIVVRKVEDGYIVLDGRARLESAIKIGLKAIPAIMCILTDKQVEDIRAISSVSRIPIDRKEYAKQLDRFLKTYSYEELANKLNISVKRLKELQNYNGT